MKRYIKNNEIRYANQIVVSKNGFDYYNPTENMILSDGWVEYVPPIIEPTLEEVKAQKIGEVEMYNMSEDVNTFSINGQPQKWLDCNERSVARNTCGALQRKGQTQVFFGGAMYPIEFALDCLDDLDIYAMETMASTEVHKANINALATKEEVEAYDFTQGYPETLNFTI